MATAAFAAALLAGCSSDATRLSDPFGNPFSAASDPAPTGSTAAVRSAKVAHPIGAVSAQPLAAPARQAAGFAPPTLSRPSLSAAPAISPRPAYNVPQTRASDVTGSVAGAASPRAAAGWSADGGTPIVAAQGETSAMLSRRYGVPEDVLLRVNGFGAAAQVQPGTRLIIPVYNAAGGASAAPRRIASAPAQSQPAPVQAKPAPHVAKAALAKPKTVAKAAPVDDSEEDAPARPAAPAVKPKPLAKAKLAAKAEKPVPTQVAAAKPVKAEAPVKAAKVEAPAAKPVKAEAPVKAAKVEAPAAKPAKAEAPAKTAKAEAPAKANVDAQPTASLPPAAPAAASADSANPEFRWPARGRIIQGFKSGGNDGINIAVPEGTSVKAAEGGVVAYSGSELKGYGNLVLIRHPNGFVSAYANNGELSVKRGETVKRGQIIAKSGQSGNVASPQLHFELRKGSTPVDPTSYLAGL